MKRLFKTALSIATVFIGMLFVNCNNDDSKNIEEPKLPNRHKLISLNQLQAEYGNTPIYERLSSFFDVNKDITNYRLEDGDYAWLDSEGIMQITNENYISYTFNVETTSSGEEFYNFIVSSDQAGNVMDMRLLEYTPSSTWLNDKTQPFSGHVKLIKNTFFDESDVSNLFNSRGNDECIVDVGWQSKCDLGGIGHYPGHPACIDGTSWEYTPVFTFGSCPEEISAGDSLTGSFPIDTSGENGTSTSGGETSTDDSTNNDGSTSTEVENCIVDSNGDCPIETVIMTPKDKECSSNNQLGNIMEALNLSFDSPLVACLSNESNCDQTNAMGDYLLENNNSQESIMFATEAAVAVCNGGEVDFENEFILDETFVTDQKLKCVYDKLKASNSNLFRSTIGNFINDPKLKMTIKKGNCITTDDACCDDSNIATTGVVNIIIEDTGGSVLEIAAMILHEAIHAEISRYVLLQAPGEDVNDRPRILQLFKYYKAYYNEGDIEHIYMTEHYINPIASALRKLDNYSYPVDYYKSYAWDGLRAWDANNLLSMQEDSNYSTYKTIVEANTSLSCD